jgi:hypothetical protein
MTTAHEIGAALGVANPLGSCDCRLPKPDSPPAIEMDLWARPMLAGVVAALTLLTVPTVQPTGIARTGLHGG